MLYVTGTVQRQLSWLKAGHALLAHESAGVNVWGLRMAVSLAGFCLYAPGLVSEQLVARVPAREQENLGFYIGTGLRVQGVGCRV